MFSNLFKELTIMKTLHRTLLMAAMLAAPFAAAQAHETDAAHRAWLKAQQIDIKPTLTITETEIPAGSSATSTGTGAPAGTAPSHMPASPSSTMPSSQGTYSRSEERRVGKEGVSTGRSGGTAEQ